MIEIILVVVVFFVYISYVNQKKLQRRLNKLEIVLAKKNVLTWDDPAQNLTDADRQLMKEMDK